MAEGSSGALITPALQGLLWATLGTSHSLLCSIAGRPEELWGPSPACPAWAQSQEQDFVWKLETLSVQYYPHADPANPLFPVFHFLFFKKTTVTQACFSCSVLCCFFFFLEDFMCLGCAILPSDAVHGFQIRFPTSFLVLAAALIFCFLHLTAIMPCNEKTGCLSPECLRQSQCFLSKHTWVIFSEYIRRLMSNSKCSREF